MFLFNKKSTLSELICCTSLTLCHVSLEIRSEIKYYLKRNQALYQNQDNANYQDAKHMLSELNNVFDKYKQLEIDEDAE